MTDDFDWNRPTHYLLDEDHQVVPLKGNSLDDLTRWMEFFFDIDNRRVGLTQVGHYEISTVFIGLGRELFETMVSDPRSPHGPRYSSWRQDRYETWQEAVMGHNLTVWKYERRLADEKPQPQC